MTEPTQELYNEHGGIFLMLKIMEALANRIETGKSVDVKDLEKVIIFLKNFADKCHHGKEEDILFPYLLKNRSNRPIVNLLLGEHKTGRDFIKGIASSVNKYRPGNPDAIHISLNMRSYVALLKDHIKKETDILFPIADKEIKAVDQVKIMKRFEKLERDVIGLGKHEEYHGWLKSLKTSYLE